MPLISIIIPTYNRPEQLLNCLDAICRQDYPKDRFEVIVVDDGSEVPPSAEIARFEQSLDIRLITQSNTGPAKARNTGAQHVGGKYIAFIDDDCNPAPNWLKNLERCFKDNPGCMIGGKTINAIRNNVYSTTSQMIIDIVYNLCNKQHDEATFLASNNLAVPTKEFNSIGGFDVTYRTAEDRNLCARWLNTGYRIVYSSDVVIYHASVLNFKKFYKQFFYYGRGAYHFHIDKANAVVKQSYSWLFHINLKKWLFYPFSQLPFFKALPVSFLLIIWEIANITGFFWEKINFNNDTVNNPKSLTSRQGAKTVGLTEKSS